MGGWTGSQGALGLIGVLGPRLRGDDGGWRVGWGQYQRGGPGACGGDG